MNGQRPRKEDFGKRSRQENLGLQFKKKTKQGLCLQGREKEK